MALVDVSKQRSRSCRISLCVGSTRVEALSQKATTICCASSSSSVSCCGFLLFVESVWPRAFTRRRGSSMSRASEPGPLCPRYCASEPQAANQGSGVPLRTLGPSILSGDSSTVGAQRSPKYSNACRMKSFSAGGAGGTFPCDLFVSDAAPLRQLLDLRGSKSSAGGAG